MRCHKHTHRTNICGGQDDLICDCGEDEGGGGGVGSVRVKGGAFPFKLRLKASEAVTLDLKRSPGGTHKQVLEQL